MYYIVTATVALAFVHPNTSAKGASITRFLKISSYFLATCGVIGLGSMVLINKEVIAIQLNDWHLSPRNQDLTELYFTDYRTLPKSLKAGSAHTVTFTVHNLERKRTTYQYSLIAAPENSDTKQELGHGEITLAPERSQVITETITIPALSERIAIKVNLAYQGVTFGDNAPSQQAQTIHYWVRVGDLPKATNKDTHER